MRLRYEGCSLKASRALAALGVLVFADEMLACLCGAVGRVVPLWTWHLKAILCREEEGTREIHGRQTCVYSTVAHVRAAINDGLLDELLISFAGENSSSQRVQQAAQKYQRTFDKLCALKFEVSRNLLCGCMYLCACEQTYILTRTRHSMAVQTCSSRQKTLD
jgi:hypothetical protein